MHQPKPQPRSVISVDVEDYFHAEAFSTIVDSADWGNRISRVERNTVKILELLARLEIHGTFFVLGWVAQQYPGLVRQIATAGHELASHSYWHRQIFRLEPGEFRADTQRAKDVIEQITGQPIYGYRAPTFSIVESTLWALDILAELGFQYDSSIFPIRHDRYGIPHAPRFPFRVTTPAGTIVEYPIATFRVWGKWNMPVGGGGYLRLYPEWYTRLGLRRAEREQLPVISYIHPWELDPHQPDLRPPFTTRIRHYTNLAKTEKRLEAMLRNGNFTSFRESGLDETVADCDIAAWGKNATK
jgi:polysaccharide deacetylase family protein (PEP-CTERM system associated)